MNMLIERSWVRLITLIFVVMVAALIFSMGIIRGKCISKGYELSMMASEIEKRRIAIEQVDKTRAALMSKEYLFSQALKKNFVFMQEGKTFNVQ